MIEYLLVAFTFFLFVISTKTVGLLPFPTILILFLGLSQVVSILVVTDTVRYDIHSILYDFGGLEANLTTVNCIYSSLALIALLSLSGKFRTLRSVDFTGTLRRLLSTRSSARFVWTLIAIVLCSVHFALYLLVTDWSQLWLYEKYLSVGMDVKWVALFGESVSDTILKTGPAFAILSCLTVCSLIGTKHTVLKFLAGALTVFYFAIAVSQHSRSAAFFPLLLAVNFALLRLKWRTIVIPILVFVAVVALLGALIGRNTDRHGLSTLPETIASPFVNADPLYVISQAIVDSCQGIIVTAESIQIEADFDPWYKILAFSPIPSYIDGYSSIREENEHRLHEYIPMSGVGEAFHFGWFYIGLLLIGYIIGIRAHTKIAAKNPAIFILVNLLITLSIYVLLAYPLRNSLRFYWIALALILAVNLTSRGSVKGRRGSLRRRYHQRDRLAHSSELGSVSSSE